MTAKKVINLLAILCLVYSQTSWGREIPLPEISLPQCKIYKRSEMPENCKVKLPLLDPSQYTSQLLNNAARLTYSMLRGATYTDGRNTKVGGHPAIDLPTALGTPVKAIGDGKVVKAQAVPGYGNNVTIEHTDGTGKFYSSYSHLNTIEVTVGALVKQDQQIGTVGRSGNSDGMYGYHLDFQILRDSTLKGPYGYGNCSSGYLDAVNNGTCRDKLAQATIDPLAFFAQKGVKSTSTFEELQREIDTTIIQKPITIVDAGVSSATSLLVAAPQVTSTKTAPKGIQSLFHTSADTEEETVTPLLSTTSTTTTTAAVAPIIPVASTPVSVTKPTTTPVTAPVLTPFLQPTLDGATKSSSVNDGRFATNDGKYRFKLKITTPYIDEGETSMVELLVQDQKGNPVQGVLTYPIKVSVGNNTIAIFPESVSFMQEGKKVIRITGENAGKDSISITYNLQEVTKGEIVVSN